MKERPLIVTTDLIPKVLDGTKTQTRRVIKPQPKDNGDWKLCTNVYDHNIGEFCPYGQVGDRLWVRETWRVHKVEDNKKPRWLTRQKVWYRTTPLGDSVVEYDQVCDGAGKWRPSIFMPRWASRITLEITNLRVERLQEITDTDAKAEGVKSTYPVLSYREAFIILWDSLNAKRGYSWESNPWVWVIQFRKVVG